MLNIDPLQATFHAASQLQESKEKTKKTETKKKSLFSKLISEHSDEQKSLASLPPELANLSVEEAKQVLVDSVYSAGDLLKKKPFADSFIIYKKAISEFLRFVVDESYKVKEQEGPIHKNKAGIFVKNQYTIIETINKDLDKLAQDILYNQLEQMKLVARVDGITGLLINTFS